MSLEQHAEKELRLAGYFDEDSDYGGMIGNAVMELVRKFASQGHSGASAAQTIQAFSIVAGYRNLSPVHDKAEEWIEIAAHMRPEGAVTQYQNARASAMFKDGANGRPYFLDAIIWRTPSGSTWSGSAQLPNGKRVWSRQYVKKFPFFPKSFYVDVTEEEVEKDQWVFHVKDLDQLRKVWELYDEYEPEARAEPKEPPAAMSTVNGN